jgi:hypothetical protein
MESEIPFVHAGLNQFLVRFGINLLFLILIARFIYRRKSGSTDFLFTLYMMNILVFFICFTLEKIDNLGLGMALGLFAIFAILRYRTTTIPIKEMTYLFMIIGVAVINSLSNQQTSLWELAITNVTIAGFAAVLEAIPVSNREQRETIVYERIDLIQPQHHGELVADLEARTGLKIHRVELGKIDFQRGIVTVDVYYYAQDQDRPEGGDSRVLRKGR